MMYFNEVNNLNELKSRFRQLAFKLHPDKGGNEKEFSAMQQEYEARYRQLKRNEEEGIQSNRNAGAAQRSTIWEDLRRKYHKGPTTGPKAGPTKRKKAHKPDDDGYFNIIEVLIHLDGIIIEQCGSWLWLSGKTKEHTKALKDAGCRLARKKKMWYWRPADAACNNRRKRGYRSMAYIRKKYGSVKITAEEEMRHYF